ncbi:MAG: PEFG-CTERM sorting domain-containing protein [Nitrosotalea sp.]
MKISVKGLVLLGILLSAAGISPVFAQMANSTGSNSTASNSTAMNMGSNSTANPAMNMGSNYTAPPGSLAHPIYNYTVPTNLPPPSYLITNESGSSSAIASMGLPTSVVTVTTDQSSYNDGDKMVISGSTKDYLGDTPLTLILRNPVGNIVTISQIPIGSDKTFSTDLTAGGALWQAAGAYSIYVQYGGPDRSATTTFQFSGSHVSSGTTIPVDGTNMSVTYSITNGKVLDIKADTNSKSLIVSIQTNGDGTLTINMPRALIDAKKTDGSDDQFFVLNDGQENDQFQETSNTATARTLQIPFTDGTSQIEIIGTIVIPEFGPIAAIVLAIAIISIIAISTKTRLRFTPRV